MKIVFDRSRCKLHAQCRGAAPELFDFAPDGSLVVLFLLRRDEIREVGLFGVEGFMVIWF